MNNLLHQEKKNLTKKIKELKQKIKFHEEKIEVSQKTPRNSNKFRDSKQINKTQVHNYLKIKSILFENQE